MKISIVLGSIEHLEACAEILKHSSLGMTYFTDSNRHYIGEKLLQEGFDKNEIYVALDNANNCVGFAWIQLNGIFHWFPFLHVVVVQKQLRGQGIGKRLMSFFEHIAFEVDKSRKAFLMVGDFNQDAIDLYKHLGYVKVGAVPGLFIPDVTELLMMKAISR